MKKFGIYIILFLLFSINLYCTNVVKVIKPESEKDVRQFYYEKILILALEKTKSKYGEYKIERVDIGYQGRSATLLAEGSPMLDLIWTMTNRERKNNATCKDTAFKRSYGIQTAYN